MNERMIRIKSAVLQASKVIDFQVHLFDIKYPGQSPFTLHLQCKVVDFHVHLFVIKYPGQSPFTLPLQSCSSLETSSMEVGE